MMHVMSQIEYRKNGAGHIVARYVVVRQFHSGNCRQACIFGVLG